MIILKFMSLAKQIIPKTKNNMEQNEELTPVCPECGSTDVEILDDEKVAICHSCWLEWPYSDNESHSE